MENLLRALFITQKMKSSAATSIFLLLFLGQASAQPGFNHTYTLDYPQSAFVNTLYAHGHIYGYAIVRDSSQGNVIGLEFIKMDTNGTVVNKFPYFDSNGLSVGADDNYAMILLSNGHIGVNATYYSGYNKLLLVFDSLGTFHVQKVIEYNSFHVQSELEEMPNGFMMAGRVSVPHPSGNIGKIFITATDEFGNIKWYNEYSEQESYEYNVFDIFYADNNSYIVSAVEGPNLYTSHSYLLCVDSLGALKWVFKGTPDLEETIVNSTHKLANNNWVYATNKVYSLNGSDKTISKLVCRDTAFNLVWEKEISPTNWLFNGILDMKPTPDGNFVLAARWAPGPNFESPEWRAGCLYKFTPEGEELWMVCDTPHWGVPVPLASQDLNVGGLAVLPSGSVVLAGSAQRSVPSPSRIYGWMFKVDANGCQYAPCQVSASSPVGKPEKLFAFPNPGRGEVSVRLPDLSQGGRLEVFDAFGRKVLEKPSEPSVEAAYLDTTNWPPGTYIVHVYASGGRLVGVAMLVVVG